MFEGQIHVGQGLGLHPLAGVDQQQGALAGGQRSGYLVGEIDMSRGIDQVQDVRLSVLGGVRQANRLAFDGDPSFAFDVHAVEDLILKLPLRHDMGGLDQSVRQSRLPMIDMGDDAEVA